MKNNNNNWKVERAKKVIELLHTGIQTEDGEVRDFNILDYYKIINLSPKALYESTRDELSNFFTELELKNFYSFVVKSSNDSKLTTKAIMEVKHSVLINDELVEITDLDKTAVITSLRAKKIPLTSNLYAVALRDYLNEKYCLNEEKSKTY